MATSRPAIFRESSFTGESMDRLKQLHDAGQSIWLDFIDRTLLRSGELARRIERDSLTGMTSNPTIFEKALAEGHAYDSQLAGASPDLSAWELFELVETDDVRAACDIFRPIHEKTQRRGWLRVDRGVAGLRAQHG